MTWFSVYSKNTLIQSMSRKLPPGLCMKPGVCFPHLYLNARSRMLEVGARSLTVQWRHQPILFYFQISNRICRILQDEKSLTIIRVFIGNWGFPSCRTLLKDRRVSFPTFSGFQNKDDFLYAHCCFSFPATTLGHMQNHHRFCPSNLPRAGVFQFYLIRLLSDLTSTHLSLCSLEGVCLEGFRSPSTLGFTIWPTDRLWTWLAFPQHLSTDAIGIPPPDWGISPPTINYQTKVRNDAVMKLAGVIKQIFPAPTASNKMNIRPRLDVHILINMFRTFNIKSEYIYAPMLVYKIWRPA